MYQETHVRTLVKTISWRVVATITTIFLVLIFTGKLTIAITIGVIEVFLKMLIYFIHERVWNRIQFGKRLNENSSIQQKSGDL